VLPQLMKLKGTAIDLLYPKRCIGCHMEGDFLCDSCLAGIKRLFPPLCPLCGRPQINGVLCQDCVSWNAAIDGIRAPFRFEGIMREVIHQYKYKFISAMSSRLAGLLSDYLENYPLNVDTIISVPLHPKRLRERGYNQSALLASELGKITGLSVIKDSLVRRQYTTPQAKTL